MSFEICLLLLFYSACCCPRPAGEVRLLSILCQRRLASAAVKSHSAPSSSIVSRPQPATKARQKSSLASITTLSPSTSPFDKQSSSPLHHVLRPSYHSFLTWSAPLQSSAFALTSLTWPSPLASLLTVSRCDSCIVLCHSQMVTCSRSSMPSRLSGRVPQL